MVGDTEARNLHNILTVMIMITRLIFACICASPPPPPPPPPVMIILTRLIFDYICSQPCPPSPPPPPPPHTHTHTTHNLSAEVGILKPTVPVYSTECANYHTVAYICCTEVFYVPVTLSEGHCEKFGKYRQVELYPEERVEHTRVPGENLWDYQPENQYYLLTDESPFCPLKLSSVGKSHNHHFDYFCYCYRVSVFFMLQVKHYRPSVFKRWMWDLQCAVLQKNKVRQTLVSLLECWLRRTENWLFTLSHPEIEPFATGFIAQQPQTPKPLFWKNNDAWWWWQWWWSWYHTTCTDEDEK